jgi:hypothetical protein
VSTAGALVGKQVESSRAGCAATRRDLDLGPVEVWVVSSFLFNFAGYRESVRKCKGQESDGTVARSCD